MKRIAINIILIGMLVLNFPQNSISTLLSLNLENPWGNAASGTVWYVATTGNDGNACRLVSAPCATMNGAIVKASDGDTVKVAIGIYPAVTAVPVVTINKSITLSGGWNSGFSTQNGMTVIDGQKTSLGISIPAGITSTVELMNIKNVVGGVENSGTLHFNKSTVSKSAGAGITNKGSLTLDYSGLNNNSSWYGGGLYNQSGTSVLNNSTVGRNNSSSGGGIGIDAGSVSLNNSTVSGNISAEGGGIGHGAYMGGSVTMHNSILAGNANTVSGIGNTSPDSSMLITSEGNNLIGNTTGFGFTPAAGDLVNVDPNLGRLIGLPAYFPLLSSSPAIEAGNACLPVDQRGITRPVGAICDIGSYEYVTPGVADDMILISGDSQWVSPFNPLAVPLIVAVLDMNGSPVSGVTVTFSAPSSGPSGVFANTGTNSTTVDTGENGIAQSASFTANAVLGAYTVIASAAGIASVLNFSLENRAWFVGPGGNDANTCNSVANRCATINGGLAKADMGGKIFIASGTYTGSNYVPVVTVDRDITLSGGWNNAFSLQNGLSIIDSQNARKGMQIYNSVLNVTVEIFIIENGHTNYETGSAITLGDSGTLTLTNSILRSNVYQYGGALEATNLGNITLNNSIIEGNSGLGLNTHHGGMITLNHSTIRSNLGEGINNLGTVTLNSSTVSSNRGVGVRAGTINLNNSTISGNMDTGIVGSVINLNNSTVTDNVTSSDQGGGIYSLATTAILHNSIVAGNHSPDSPDCSGTITSAGYNLIGDTTGCTFTSSTGDQLNLDPMLVPLVGTPGYHPLAPDSPAVDAGNDCLAADQRGISRPVGLACDIGSYEYQLPGSSFQITAVGYTDQSTRSSTPFPHPLQVAVLDAVGSPVSGVNVTFTAPASGPSGIFTGSTVGTETIQTDTAGLATSSTFTANTIYGYYHVTASVAGLTGTAEFTLLNRCDVLLPLVSRPVDPPAAFTKSSPQNSSQNLKIDRVDFYWNSSLHADSYEYCVDTTNNGSCDTGWFTTGTDTHAILTSLLRDTTYYWQVRAMNEGGSTYADGGVWWQFTTIFAPKAGFWISPDNYVDFYVTPDRNNVSGFRILVNLPGCGTYWISRPIPGGDAPITLNYYGDGYNFSFGTGEAFFSAGSFTSAIAISGSTEFNQLGPICGEYWSTTQPLYWTASWVDASQPASSSATLLPSLIPDLPAQIRKATPGSRTPFTARSVK